MKLNVCIKQLLRHFPNQYFPVINLPKHADIVFTFLRTFQVIQMSRFLINGDIHLKKVDDKVLQYHVSVRGGLIVSQINEQVFHQEYDVFFLLVGGNDIHYHDFQNPNPKTDRGNS